MKALVSTGEGGVRLADVPEPQSGPGQTLVTTRAVSVNRGELRSLHRDAGAVHGWDVAGVLEQDAAGLARGTAVLGMVDEGAWAERVAVRTDRLAVIPEGVSFEQAAALPVAGLTALQTLRIGGLLVGRRVLVTGAAGGVGRYAVQIARLAGAHVTGIARDGGRAAGLEALGADAVVRGIEEAQGPFDLILESVGGGSLTRAFGLLAPGGDLVSFGGSCDRPGVYDPRALFNASPGARIHAYQVFEVPGAGADLALLLELVRTGRLDPQIERVSPWEEANAILAALAERRINGKGVLRVHGEPGR
jgi:NADPH:quinone reductase-like Zn-dependent oxidoreductase